MSDKTKMRRIRARRLLWVLLSVVTFLGGCTATNNSSDAAINADALVGCADAYVAMTIGAPDAEAFDVCLPMQHLRLNFPGSSCTLSTSSASSLMTNGSSLMFYGDGDWFAREAEVEPFVISYSTTSSSACGGFDAGSCQYMANTGCRAHVTLAAPSLGEYTEGELSEPCQLLSRDDSEDPPLELKRLRFRARVAVTPEPFFGPDGAVCMYSPDGGTAP